MSGPKKSKVNSASDSAKNRIKCGEGCYNIYIFLHCTPAMVKPRMHLIKGSCKLTACYFFFFLSAPKQAVCFPSPGALSAINNQV